RLPAAGADTGSDRELGIHQGRLSLASAVATQTATFFAKVAVFSLRDESSRSARDCERLRTRGPPWATSPGPLGLPPSPPPLRGGLAADGSANGLADTATNAAPGPTTAAGRLAYTTADTTPGPANGPANAAATNRLLDAGAPSAFTNRSLHPSPCPLGGHRRP